MNRFITAPLRRIAKSVHSPADLTILTLIVTLAVVLLASLFAWSSTAQAASPATSPASIAIPPEMVDLIRRTPPNVDQTFEFEIDHKEATGRGAGLTTTADDVAGKFKSSAPQADLGPDGPGSSGSDTEASWKLGSSSTFKSPLLWVGILCLLAAGAAAYFRSLRGCLVCGVLGFVLIAAAAFPQLSALLAAIGIAGAVAVYIYAEKNAVSFREASRAMLAGISDLSDPTHPASDPGAAAKLKTAINSHAVHTDQATMATIRNADNLRG